MHLMLTVRGGGGGSGLLIRGIRGASLSKGIIHLALSHFLFEFHSPILEPDLYLSFRKAELGGELCAPLTSEEVVVMEFLLKFKNLFWRVHSSHAHEVCPGPASAIVGLLALTRPGLGPRQLRQQRGGGEASSLRCLGEASHTREAAEAEEGGRGHEAAREHLSPTGTCRGFLSLYEQSEIIQVWQIRLDYKQGKLMVQWNEMHCFTLSIFIFKSLAFMIHGFVISESVLIFEWSLTEWTWYWQHIDLLVHVTHMNLQNFLVFETFETIGTRVAWKHVNFYFVIGLYDTWICG